MSNFKLIFLGIFIAGAIIGVLVFSGIINLGTGSSEVEAPKGSVTIWGPFPSSSMQDFISEFNLQNKDIKITYVAKDPATFDATLVEAIAIGQSPDLILVPDNLIWRFQDKLSHITYDSLPAQTFQSSFISAANVFLVSDGTVAIPWAADPLVMYYNRDLLQSIGVALPPKNWTDFTQSVGLLAKKKPDLTLTQMAAGLGGYANIAHAKDILALLSMESGSPFITSDGTRVLVRFGATGTAIEDGAVISAVNFYMGFSNPLNDAYTWNAGLPLDRDAFIDSSLAYYFGTASELPVIRKQNPNLNFGIALPPQQPTGTPLTTGRLYGFAIPKGAPNPQLSFAATVLLSSPAAQKYLVTKLGTQLTLVPIRRDVLSGKPKGDPYLGFLFDAALIQRSWLDPNPIISNQIFSTLIRDISSSALDTNQALLKASSQLGAL